MSNTCPHGHRTPPTAADLGPLTPAGPVPAPRMVVVHDNRWCPECLQERVKQADDILNKMFSGRRFTAEIYGMWTKYVTRYNP